MKNSISLSTYGSVGVGGLWSHVQDTDHIHRSPRCIGFRARTSGHSPHPPGGCQGCTLIKTKRCYIQYVGTRSPPRKVRYGTYPNTQTTPPNSHLTPASIPPPLPVARRNTEGRMRRSRGFFVFQHKSGISVFEIEGYEKTSSKIEATSQC